MVNEGRITTCTALWHQNGIHAMHSKKKQDILQMGNCSSNEDKIGALCYDKCPTGLHHVPGIPTSCVGDRGITYDRGAGHLMACKKGEIKDGLLCYPEPPPGWSSHAGIQAAPCPEGTQNNTPLICGRQTSDRGAGGIPWLGLFMNKGIVATICIIIALYIVIRVGSAVYAAKKGKQ